MTDLYLKTLTEDDMDAALTAAGLIEEGQPVSGVCIDVIGPFTRFDYSVEPPVETHYPEWHVNVRCDDLTETELAVLTPITIIPPEQPYRVWA